MLNSCKKSFTNNEFFSAKPKYSQISNKFHIFYNDIKIIFNQWFVDGIATISANKSIRFTPFVHFYCAALSGLTHLENFLDKIFILSTAHAYRFRATNHEHLKRIHFCKSTVRRLQLLMGGSSKFESIRIDWFMDESGNIDNKKVLNLAVLDLERARVVSAKEITLFVEEPVYLATNIRKIKYSLFQGFNHYHD